MRWLALTVTILALCVSAAPYPIYKIAAYSSAPFSAVVADMDNDGGNDIITLAKNGGDSTVYFLENQPTMGFGRIWVGYEVDPIGHDYALYAADLDSANYLDIVHSNGAGYLNGGSSDNWTSFTIDPENTIVVKGAADINADGDEDVIYEASNRGGWYENAGNGTNWTAHADTFGHVPITALDVDGDHDWDVFTYIDNFGAPDHFYIAENTDGSGGSWNEYEITIINDNINASRGVAVLDADGNSTADICVAVVAETAGNVLTLSVDAGSSVVAVDEGTAYSTVVGGDFDGDGFDEVVAYDYSAKTAYLFDNLTTSPTKTEVRTEFKPLCAGDVNNDGTDDVVGYSIADSVFVWLDFQRTLYPDFVSPDHVPPGNGTLGTFELYQSKPNPSYGDATITFTVPETTDVRLAVYDIAGRKIAVLADDVLPAGEHTYEVSELPAGVYVYRLVAGSYIAVKKMVVL